MKRALFVVFFEKWYAIMAYKESIEKDLGSSPRLFNFFRSFDFISASGSAGSPTFGNFVKDDTKACERPAIN